MWFEIKKKTKKNSRHSHVIYIPYDEQQSNKEQQKD